MAKYPNLPGIEVNIADGGLILPEDASTQSLLIIAPSLEEGAPTEPVLVRDSSELISYGFGEFVKSNEVNPIAAAWKQAFEGGARRIFLMALEGATDAEKFLFAQDALFGMLADFAVDHIALVGVYADKEAVLTELPELEEGVIHEFAIEGASAVTFPLVVTVGTNDSFSVDSEVVTVAALTYGDAEALESELNGKMLAAGVTNIVANITKGNKVRLVGGATFTVAAGTPGSLLTPLKITAGPAVEKMTGNFAKLLGQFAETQTLNHNAAVGYIGAQAPLSNGLANVKTNVDRLAQIENEYSGYVSAIAGPELGYVVPGKTGLYFTNGVVSYAALVVGLKPESATTQKVVYGVAGVHYQLSLRQLNALTGNKFVTFRVKNNQVIVTDGVTTAPDFYVSGTKRSSDFTRLSTLRITQAAAQLVREICEPYVGEPNRMPQYNALNAAVKGGLEAMKAQGAINDYRFSVRVRGANLNEAVITLEIIPAFELRKVSIDVSLRPNFLA